MEKGIPWSTTPTRGSFLEYFDNRIKNLIGDPYREAAVEQMIITDSTDPNTYGYTTIITYKCRQIHGRLQKDVTWAPAIGEFLEVRRVRVELQLPPDSIIRENLHLKNQAWDSHQEADAQPAYHSDARTYEFTSDKLMKYDRDPNNERKFSVPLHVFGEYDGLLVKITGEGTIPTTGFIGWGMSHPTKGFVLMCQPPPGKYARHESFSE